MRNSIHDPSRTRGIPIPFSPRELLEKEREEMQLLQNEMEAEQREYLMYERIMRSRLEKQPNAQLKAVDQGAPITGDVDIEAQWNQRNSNPPQESTFLRHLAAIQDRTYSGGTEPWLTSFADIVSMHGLQMLDPIISTKQASLLESDDPYCPEEGIFDFEL